MAKSRSDIVYIGVGGHVVALDPTSGTELWRTKLKSSSFTTIHHVGTRIFAGAGGEMFCLDTAAGQIIWRNKLKGLGLGVIAFTSTEETAVFAEVQAQQAAAAAAAGA